MRWRRPSAKSTRTLGGAATYFSVAASYFTHVNLVGVVGDDFTKADAAVFSGRRIDICGLEHAPGKTFFWAGRYGADPNERVTLATELNVFATFKPKLPQAFRSSKHVFLANIDPTLQHSVLQQIHGKPRMVALDTMNYWIEKTPAELRTILAHTQILMINDAEARMLTSEHNLLRAARHIFKLGPTALVVKRGEHGAMMVHEGGIFSVPAFPFEEVHDPTGAGDSFAGGFMGYLSERADAERCRHAPRHGLRLGDGQLRRGEVRPRAHSPRHAPRNRRPRPALL